MGLLFLRHWLTQGHRVGADGAFKEGDGSKSDSDYLLACCHHTSAVWLILGADKVLEGCAQPPQSIYASV